jgi:hypothetical protein
MTNRDLLKEAIADAKAVKETAIANAKLALEEAFTPFLKEKLAAKLAEMEEEEVEETMVDEGKEEIEENFDLDEIEESEDLDEIEESEDLDEIEESEDLDEIEESEDLDEMDLDELLKELDELDEDELINDPKQSTSHGNIAEGEEEEEEEEETFDIENMSEEDLKSFIESVINDMVSSGELEGSTESEEDEEIDLEIEDDEDEDEDIDLEEMLSERKTYGGKKGDIPSARRGKIKKSTAEEEGVEDYKKKLKETEDKLEEAYKTIKTIKSEINEVNLLNAKLLYTNKIFRSKNLTESQKVNILETFDKATNVKEVKLIYETLNTKKTKTTSVNESMVGRASKTIVNESLTKPILEVDNQFSRWQKLAGIKK